MKSLMYGELFNGSRSVGRPKLRYKNTCKSVLKLGKMLDSWQDIVGNRQVSEAAGEL